MVSIGVTPSIAMNPILDQTTIDQLIAPLTTNLAFGQTIDRLIAPLTTNLAFGQTIDRLIAPLAMNPILDQTTIDQLFGPTGYELREHTSIASEAGLPSPSNFEAWSGVSVETVLIYMGGCFALTLIALVASNEGTRDWVNEFWMYLFGTWVVLRWMHPAPRVGNQ